MLAPSEPHSDTAAAQLSEDSPNSVWLWTTQKLLSSFHLAEEVT